MIGREARKRRAPNGGYRGVYFLLGSAAPRLPAYDSGQGGPAHEAQPCQTDQPSTFPLLGEGGQLGTLGTDRVDMVGEVTRLAAEPMHCSRREAKIERSRGQDETRDTSDPQPVGYRVWLNWSRPHYGGRRYWFCCPGTGDRTTKLFLPPGGHRFLSRGAYRLGYACQREARHDRLLRKARKLNRALGGDGASLEGEAPSKPKGMHWQTYQRKVAALTAMEERADEACLLSMAPLFSRLCR